MSRREKSNILYPHPFSKAYWRDAASELKDTRILVFAALMIAVRAEEIRSNIRENGGTLQVVYAIVIEEETAGMIEYRIEVRLKP